MVGAAARLEKGGQSRGANRDEVNTVHHWLFYA